MIDAKEFLRETVKLGKTEFKIKKLPALDAFDVLEKLRLQLAKAAAVGETETSELLNIIRTLSLLPTEFVSDLRKTLFSYVTFKRDSDNTYLALAGEMWGMAFEHCDPADIYELLIRCLVINFFSSIEKVKGLMKKTNRGIPMPAAVPPTA